MQDRAGEGQRGRKDNTSNTMGMQSQGSGAFHSHKISYTIGKNNFVCKKDSSEIRKSPLKISYAFPIEWNTHDTRQLKFESAVGRGVYNSLAEHKKSSFFMETTCGL